MAFRLSLSRHSLRLDCQASEQAVEEYAKVLLAEFEVLSLASEPSFAKKQRLRKMKDSEGAPVPKFPPKSDPPAPPPKLEEARVDFRGKDRPPGGNSKLCTQWLTLSGCAFGDRCRFVHQGDDSRTSPGFEVVVTFVARRATGRTPV